MDNQYKTKKDMRGIDSEWVLPKGSVSTGRTEQDGSDTLIEFPGGVWFYLSEIKANTDDFENEVLL